MHSSLTDMHQRRGMVIGRFGVCGTESRIQYDDVTVKVSVDEKIVDFIKKSDICTEALNKQLEALDAEVTWPLEGSDVIIRHKQTVITLHTTKLRQRWEAAVKKKFTGFIDKLICNEHHILNGGWEFVFENIGNIVVENPEAVAIFVDKKLLTIRVVGYKLAAELISRKIRRLEMEYDRTLQYGEQNDVK